MDSAVFLRRLSLALPVVGALYLVVPFVVPLGARGTSALVNLILFVIPATVAGLAWRRAAQLQARERTAWRLLAIGSSSWAVGQAALIAYRVALRRLEPIPSIADVAYVGFAVATAAGLLALQPRGNLAAKVRLGLDAAVVGAAFLFLLLGSPWGRLLQSYEADAAEQAVILLYPLADIALLAIAAISLSRANLGSRGWQLLVAGVAAIAASDMSYLYLRLRGVLGASEPMAIGWHEGVSLVLLVVAAPIGFGLISIASTRASSVPAPVARPPTHVSALLPVFVAATSALVGLLGSLALSQTQAIAGLLLMALLLLRSAALSFEEIRLRRAANDARRAVERLEEERAILLRSIGHDLANPLVPIQLQLGILAMKDPEGRLKPSLDVIGRGLDQVKRLAQDLSEVARAGKGQFDVKATRTDVAAVVRNVVASEAPNAAKRQVGLKLHAEHSVAHADPGRVQQVVANLVRNALKFTPAGGGVAVHCRPAKDGVVVRVQDTGRGLAPRDLERLFEPFVQVGERPAGEDRGTGLGLYISRRIVEAHGGKLWAESPGPGHGSTFTFELPRMPPDAAGDRRG